VKQKLGTDGRKNYDRVNKDTVFLSVGREAIDVVHQENESDNDRTEDNSMSLFIGREAIDVIGEQECEGGKQCSPNQQSSETPLIGPSAIYVQ